MNPLSLLTGLSSLSAGFWLKGALALLLFTAGVFSGYKLGSHGKQALENELDQIAHISAENTKTFEKAKEEFSKAVAEIQAEFKKKMDFTLAEKEKNESSWQAELSKSSSKITALQSQIASSNLSITQLKGLIASSTDAAVVAELQNQLALKEALLKDLQLKQAGLECMDTPIPEEFIRIFNKSGHLAE